MTQTNSIFRTPATKASHRFTAAFILGLMSLFSSCIKHTKPYIGTSMHVIYDVTKPLASSPQAEALLSLFDLHGEGQQATLELTIMRGRLLNPSVTMASQPLPVGTGTKERTLRDECVTNFANAVQMELVDYPQQYIDAPIKPRMETYATVADALSNMVASSASRRYVVIYSGLEEEEPGFSTKSGKDVALLQSDPLAVAQVLQGRRSLPDNLMGITVVFVFAPRTAEEATIFSHMVLVYKDMLLNRGATVRIQSQSNYFNI